MQDEFAPQGLGLTFLKSEFELAWAAGFLDGDGTITLEKRGTPKPTISIAQVEREPLDRFCSAVGVGKVNGPYECYKRQDSFKNARSQYKYQAGGIDNVRQINSLLAPYLSERKREKLAQMIEDSKDVIGRVRKNG